VGRAEAAGALVWLWVGGGKGGWQAWAAAVQLLPAGAGEAATAMHALRLLLPDCKHWAALPALCNKVP
jgi:hypothetical protein